jgi:hypothetical protein
MSKYGDMKMEAERRNEWRSWVSEKPPGCEINRKRIPGALLSSGIVPPI